MAMTWASGNSSARAIARQPLPVPTSTIRRLERPRLASMAVSIDELGFGSGNQHVVRDLEVEPPELSMPGDERDRFSRRAAPDEGREALREVDRRGFPSAGQQRGAVPAERVTREDFRVERRVGRRNPAAHQRLPRVGDLLVD